MRDHVVLYLNGKRVAIGGDDAFRRWSSSSASERLWSAPRSAVPRGTAAPARSWSAMPEAGTIRYRPIGSCIRPLYQLDGMHIVTIEGLTPPEGPSPIQQAMVDHHGSQCGFCTPGFVDCAGRASSSREPSGRR